jgi:hypothetical protein
MDGWTIGATRSDEGGVACDSFQITALGIEEWSDELLGRLVKRICLNIREGSPRTAADEVDALRVEVRTN